MISFQKVSRGFAVCCLFGRKLRTVYGKEKVNTAQCFRLRHFSGTHKRSFFTSPESLPCTPSPAPPPWLPSLPFSGMMCANSTEECCMENTLSLTKSIECGIHSFMHSFTRSLTRGQSNRDSWTITVCQEQSGTRPMAPASGKRGWYTRDSKLAPQ